MVTNACGIELERLQVLISSPIPSTIACCDGVAVLLVVKSCLDEEAISWINCSSGSLGEGWVVDGYEIGA